MPITWLDRICAECGAAFRRRKGTAGTLTYCSSRCRFAAARDFMPKGDRHPNWKGGTSERPHAVRRAIAKRVNDAGACEHCGSVDNLHGHHKKGYAKHPELGTLASNIEVVCAICHAKEHPELAGMILKPAIRTGAYITCVVCSNARYVSPYLIGTAKYCSKQCQRAALHAKMRKGGITKLPIACGICGATRMAPAYAVRNGIAKYCSRKCSRSAMHRGNVGNKHASRRLRLRDTSS